MSWWNEEANGILILLSLPALSLAFAFCMHWSWSMADLSALTGLNPRLEHWLGIRIVFALLVFSGNEQRFTYMKMVSWLLVPFLLLLNLWLCLRVL